MFPPRAVAQADFERISSETLQALRGMSGLSATVSDVLDEEGWQLTVERDQLPLRTSVGGPMVGHAVTLSYLPARKNILEPGHRGEPAKLAHITAVETGRPGDVLVIDARGSNAISVLGAIGAAAAVKAGFIGCVVDGGVRDLADIAHLGFGVWSRWVTPRTGKWRLEAQAINGPVSCGGVQVLPGDLVVADETGICFIPHGAIGRVIPRVIEVADHERKQLRG